MTDKICTRCTHPKTYSEFHKCSRTRDGYKCWCKECVARDAKEKRKADPERVRQYGRKCYVKHKAKRSEYNKERYPRTKDHKLERAKRQRQENPEHFRLISARCYMRNIEKRKAYAKRYRAQNREYFYQRSKVYRNRGLSLDIPYSKDGDSNKFVRNEWQRKEDQRIAHVEACELLSELSQQWTPDQRAFTEALMCCDFDMNAVAKELNLTIDACLSVMESIKTASREGKENA